MNLRPDNTFDTGAEWSGVWTRDISYSALLALAVTHPDAVKNSLLVKVKNGVIVQDTGTGGSWPVSTDRIVWTLAAWETFLATGDVDWLLQMADIVMNTLEIDQDVVIAPSELALVNRRFWTGASKPTPPGCSRRIFSTRKTLARRPFFFNLIKFCNLLPRPRAPTPTILAGKRIKSAAPLTIFCGRKPDIMASTVMAVIICRCRRAAKHWVRR